MPTPKPRKGVKRVRIAMDVRPDVKARLSGLVETSGSDSMSEVVRRALALYECVLDYSKKGYTPVMRGSDGGDVNVEILL